MTSEPVLVTGGAGYIGSHVVKQLGEAGYEVVVYDNLSTGHDWAVLHGHLVKGDLADGGKLGQLFREYDFRTVMHFAASIAVEESVENPQKYYQNNAINAFNLWRLCAHHNVRNIVFSSTAAVYGLPENIPVDEEAPLRPINPYGFSKMMSERMLMDLAEADDINYVILRYFNVAGADPGGRIGECHDPETHLIPLTLRAALNDTATLQVNGTDYPTHDGTCVRDYIHVEDLANAHLKSLEYLDREQESAILNCGYGHGYSVREIIQAVKNVTGIDFEETNGVRRAGDAAMLVAANRRIKERLAWTPEYDDIETIIRHAYEWECRYQGKNLDN